jgi:hypothetical protein
VINVQGLTGRRSSLSVAAAGHFDLDAELEHWFSDWGKVRLDFKCKVDIRTIGRPWETTFFSHPWSRRQPTARPGQHLQVDAVRAFGELRF